MDRTQAEFVQQLLGVQTRMKVYLRSLVHDRDAADDLLQRANVVLCEKAENFKPGSDFGAWACRTAFYEVLAYRQRYAREKDKLVFDDDQVRELAAIAEEETADLDEQKRALRQCLQQLPEKQRDLIHRRYSLGRGVGEIARHLGRPVGSIRQTLFRIRVVLMSCIDGKLRIEGHHG